MSTESLRGMVNKNTITQLMQDMNADLTGFGFSVSKNGKSIAYKNYKIDFIFSPYGFDSQFGLSFFLRAESQDAPKDEWGNMDVFHEGNVIDCTPESLYRLDKRYKKNMADIYESSGKLGMTNYFCVSDEGEMKDVLLISLGGMKQLIDEKV